MSRNLLDQRGKPPLTWGEVVAFLAIGSAIGLVVVLWLA